jgi:hypothetical protein
VQTAPNRVIRQYLVRPSHSNTPATTTPTIAQKIESTFTPIFNHTIDNHPIDSHTIDNHTIDNHTIDNHTIDNHTTDNHTIDNHTIDNHTQRADRKRAVTLQLGTQKGRRLQTR